MAFVFAMAVLITALAFNAPIHSVDECSSNSTTPKTTHVQAGFVESPISPCGSGEVLMVERDLSPPIIDEDTRDEP